MGSIDVIRSVFAIIFVALGCFFFVAGIVGLVRLPDVYCRLHALTKADNVGLGFIVFGLALLEDDWFVILKMIVVWLLVLVASAGVGSIIAESAFKRGVKPWVK